MNREAVKDLLSYVARHKLELVVVFTALFTVSASLLAIGYSFRSFVDQGVAEGVVTSINSSIYQIFGLIGLFAIASFFRSFFINNISEKIGCQIKEDAYRSLLECDISKFEELKIGDIISRLGADIKSVSDLIINFLSFFVRNSVMLLGGITLMILQSPKLALLVLISVPVLLFPLLFLSKIVRRLSRQVLDEQANLASSIEESFTGIRTVYAYNQQENFSRGFAENLDKYLNLSSKRLKLRSMFFALAISCVALAIISVIWIGSIDIIEGAMSGGQMVSFIYYSIIVGLSAGGVAEIISELQGPLAALERVYELKNLKESKPVFKTLEHDQKLQKFDIEYRHINFAYPSRPDIEIYRDFSLKIAAGKFYGVVGVSGSGKSTLMQLLLKFYYQNSGHIFIGGKDIDEIPADEVRSKVAYVAQDPSIFSGSIRSNIAFSKPEATDKEIEEVAELCGISDFASKLPNGLDTEIGEKGVRISGGQKQRIAIARSLLYSPEILLLDEATSALDSDSEKQILENIRESFKDKTVISIAHRISSIEHADKIFVIDHGTVAAEGKHSTLLRVNDLYKLLCKEQKVSQ